MSILTRKGNGVRATDYRVPYLLGDFGQLTFHVAEKRPATPIVQRICNVIAQERLTGPVYSYSEAYHAAWMLADGNMT